MGSHSPTIPMYLFWPAGPFVLHAVLRTLLISALPLVRVTTSGNPSDAACDQILGILWLSFILEETGMFHVPRCFTLFFPKTCLSVHMECFLLISWTLSRKVASRRSFRSRHISKTLFKHLMGFGSLSFLALGVSQLLSGSRSSIIPKVLWLRTLCPTTWPGKGSNKSGVLRCLVVKLVLLRAADRPQKRLPAASVVRIPCFRFGSRRIKPLICSWVACYAN